MVFRLCPQMFYFSEEYFCNSVDFSLSLRYSSVHYTLLVNLFSCENASLWSGRALTTWVFTNNRFVKIFGFNKHDVRCCSSLVFQSPHCHFVGLKFEATCDR